MGQGRIVITDNGFMPKSLEEKVVNVIPQFRLKTFLPSKKTKAWTMTDGIHTSRAIFTNLAKLLLEKGFLIFMFAYLLILHLHSHLSIVFSRLKVSADFNAASCIFLRNSASVIRQAIFSANSLISLLGVMNPSIPF